MDCYDIKPLHVAISVQNLDATVKWYEDILGFTFKDLVQVPGLPCKIAFLKKGDFEMEIFEHEATLPLPQERLNPNTDNQTQGTKHICYYCPDVPALLADLRSRNVDVIMGPRRIGETTMGFIRDNNGITIEFIGPAAEI